MLRQRAGVPFSKIRVCNDDPMLPPQMATSEEWPSSLISSSWKNYGKVVSWTGETGRVGEGRTGSGSKTPVSPAMGADMEFAYEFAAC